jgi:group II intron reverse transcriptase/maturase
VVDADIKGFFDNIDHSLIMAAMCEEIADGNILGLIEKFLQAGVMEDGELYPSTRGTPQGGVVSPLLANAVLHHLDIRLDEAGYKFVRYADDFVILCKTRPQAERALDFVKNVVEQELGLQLHPEKTQIHRFADGFDFLGFHLTSRGARMRQKSLEKFKNKVRILTTRSHNLDSTVMEKLNSVCRGTVNYFATPRTFRKPIIKLAQWVRKRLRCMKKKRISDSDNLRITNKMLFRKGYQDLLDLFDRAKQRSKCSRPWATVFGSRPVQERCTLGNKGN